MSAGRYALGADSLILIGASLGLAAVASAAAGCRTGPARSRGWPRR